MSEATTAPDPIPTEAEKIEPRTKQVRTEKQLVALERARNAKKAKREARLKEAESAPVAEPEVVEPEEPEAPEPEELEAPKPKEPEKEKPKPKQKKTYVILKR